MAGDVTKVAAGTDRVLSFMWRHGSLEVDDYWETVEAAVRAAVRAEDFGECAPHGVRDGDDWVIPGSDRWKVIERAMRVEEDAARAERPRNTHVLDVLAPSGEWAVFDGFPSVDEAKEAASRFGVCRVREVGVRGPVVWSSEEPADV